MALAKLDSPDHFQAVLNAARSVYELTLDLRILEMHGNDEPVLIEKFLALATVARYDAAKKLVEEVDRLPAGSDKPDVEARGRDVDDSEKKELYRHLLDKYWNGKMPQHWTGLSIPDRIRKYLGTENLVSYRDWYAGLCWHVHSGSAGIAGLEMDALLFESCYGHRLI